MRTPFRVKTAPRAQNSRLISYPAPIGGWNARDSLAEMASADAVALDNWFPKTSYVEMRGGYSNHLTGMTGAAKTLAIYNQANGTNKMYAITVAGIFDASNAGAVGANLLARTNGKHQWVNFGDGTNNYLIGANGVDKPFYFDGTTWTPVDNVSTPALTGLTTTKIIHVGVSKGRLYFIEKDSLSFWYLAAGSAGGALTEFQLDSIAKKGGYLMAMANWTLDGGDGVDDAVVFVTSEGEVIVYKGTNPSSSTNWSLVGLFEIGKPIGRRCFEKYGGDLILLTQNGAFQLSQTLSTANINNKLAITNKIENSFNEASRSYNSNFGWEIINYPSQSAMIFNIPIAEDGTHEQYVMNTITKAWCKFKSWDAETFAIFNGELYFATSTKVVKAWTGYIDGTNNITVYGKTAFSDFGNKLMQKRFVMFRPVLAVNGNISFSADLDIDFSDKTLAGPSTSSAIAGAVWDTSLWDNSYWGSGQTIVKDWITPDNAIGYYASGKIQIASNNLIVQWLSDDFVYEAGGIL
jgi:hypothetical protein